MPRSGGTSKCGADAETGGSNGSHWLRGHSLTRTFRLSGFRSRKIPRTIFCPMGAVAIARSRARSSSVLRSRSGQSHHRREDRLRPQVHLERRWQQWTLARRASRWRDPCQASTAGSHADPARTKPTVLHQAGDHVAHIVRGDCETKATESLSRGYDCGIDPHHLAVGVDQRTAGVAVVDCRRRV